MNRNRVVHFALLGGVLGIASFLAYRRGEAVTWRGVAGGAAVAVLVCALSERFHSAAREAEGQAIVRGVMGGLIVVFGVVATSVIAVTVLFPEAASSFSLTLVSLYLVHRLHGAWLDFSSSARSRRPAEPHSLPGESRP